MTPEKKFRIERACFGIRVGKPESVQPVGKFGTWLYNERKSRELDKKQLASRAKVGQSSITQLEGGVRYPSRKMVRKLVRGLGGDNADALLVSGMRAAGFLTSHDDQELLQIAKTDPIEAAMRLLKQAQDQKNTEDVTNERPNAPTDDFNLTPMEIGRQSPPVRLPDDEDFKFKDEEDRERRPQE